MRDYGKISPTFWTRGPGRIFRGDHLAVAIATYVHTCPASNMIGLYYLPLPALCHEIGAAVEDVRAALDRLAAHDVAHYDADADLIFVPEGAADQTGATLKRADNRHKAVLRELHAFGNHRFVTAFWRRYGEAYQLGPAPVGAPSEAPSVAPYAAPPQASAEPLGSQKQDQKHEQSQGQDQAPVRDRVCEAEPVVLPRAYGAAYVRGLEVGTGIPKSMPSSTDLERLVLAIDTHARTATGEKIPISRTPEVIAWIEAQAGEFGRTADAFARRCGFAVHAFVAWLDGKGAARPGVQPAAKGATSWGDRNPNVVTAAGAKGPIHGVDR